MATSLSQLSCGFPPLREDPPCFSDPAQRHRQAYYKTLIKLHAEGKLTPQQAAILKTPRPEEELYDLQADPHQVQNLAADPKHAKTLESMRNTLAAWIKQTGDKGQQPESDQNLRIILKRWGKRCISPEFRTSDQ